MTSVESWLRGRSLDAFLRTGTGWSAFGSGGNAVLQIALFAAAAHRYSSADFGAFVLAWSLVQGGGVVLEMGLPPAVLRLVSTEVEDSSSRSRAHAVVRAAMAGPMLAGAVVVIASFLPRVRAFASSALDGGGLGFELTLVAISATLRAGERVTSDTLRGLFDIKAAVLSNGMTATGIVALALAISPRATSSVDGSLVIWLVASAVTVVLAGVRVHRLLGQAPGAIELKRAVLALRTIAVPLWGSRLTGLFYGYADIWLVAAIAPTATVGAYGAATRLAAATAMPFALVTRVTDPLTSAMAQRGDTERLETLLRIAAGFTLIPVLVSLAIYFSWGDSLLVLLFNASIDEATPILLIAALGQSVHVYFGACGSLLPLAGSPKTHFLVAAGTTPVLVFIAGLMGLAWGAVGVTTGLAVGLLIQNLAMWIFAKRETGVDTRARIPRRDEWSRLLQLARQRRE